MPLFTTVVANEALLAAAGMTVVVAFAHAAS
jgi:hypothetical protein